MSTGFLTPDLNLFAVVGLTITMSIVMIFQQQNFANMKNVWGLFSWFTLVVLPLTAVPGALKYWNLSNWYFLLIIIIDISIWVAIALKLRKKAFADRKQIDKIIISFIFYFLYLTFVIFWQLQAYDIIVQRSNGG